MSFSASPENFPGLASQINSTASGLVSSLGAQAPACVPAPPGLDDVSALIPSVFFPWGEGFFTCTAHGAVLQTEASATMPQVGAAYSGEDIISGATVTSSAATLSEY